MNTPLGFVMSDIAGCEMTPEERERLLHPAIGGVILFTRNYQSTAQLTAVTAEIHALRTPTLLIGVDHEGGRVQRFREGFTRLPAMRELGRFYEHDRQAALDCAREVGYVLAAELRACGVDLSFTPVLDLDFGTSSVIGDRAFHGDPEIVTQLAVALCRGMSRGGMGSVGKHFPGHGHVRADSHVEVPIDDRSREEIERQDLKPFAALIDAGLTGIMPAHVIYPKVDSLPAGFSRVWLRDILRGELKFEGAIFSDDLTMEGAAVADSMVERAELALRAGCDMLLVCNDPGETVALLDGLDQSAAQDTQTRLARWQPGPPTVQLAELKANRSYAAAVEGIGRIHLAERLPDPTERSYRGSA